MANRYWVGGTASWDATAGSKWATTSGGAGGQAVPTTADTVFFDANSGAGTVTIGAGVATCSTLTMTGFTGTIAFGSNSITCAGTGTIFTGATTFSVTGTPLILCSNSSGTSRTITPTATTEANSISFNITAGTGTFNITASSSVKNLNFTGFTGGLALTARIIYGNLTLVSGMTLGSGASIQTFAATSGTQTITSAGLTLDCPITFSGTATYQLVDAMSIGTATNRTVTLTTGTLDLNNNTFTIFGVFSSSSATNVRAISFGTSGKFVMTSSATTLWSVATVTTLTITGTNPLVEYTANASTGTRTIANSVTGGTEATAISFNITAGTDTITNGAGTRFKNLSFTGFAGTIANDTRNIYGNLTIPSGVTLTAGANATTFRGSSGTQSITTNTNTLDFPITFDGTATYQLVDALTSGATRTMTLTSGTLDLNNKTLTTGLVSASGSTARSILFGTTGNITVTAGNGAVWGCTTATNFTYTGTPTVNLTYSGSVGTRTITQGNTAGFTETNSPSFNFSAGSDSITVSGGVKDLNYTGFTGTQASSTRTIYGNLTLVSGMTVASSANVLTFGATSGTQTITSATQTQDYPITIASPGATVRLIDALTLGSTRQLGLSSGTLDLNNKTATAGTFSSNNSNTRSILFGTTGAITVTSTGTVYTTATSTGFTSTGTSTVNLTDSSGTLRTVTTGSGLSAAVSFYVKAGTGQVNFSSTNAVFKTIDLTGFSGTFGNSTIYLLGDFVVPSTATISPTTSSMLFISPTVQQITTSNVLVDFPIIVGRVMSTTAATGNGTTATLTFTSTSISPSVGQSINVRGVTPSGYNGTYTVTASTDTTVSYLNSTTGAQTVAGVVEMTGNVQLVDDLTMGSTRQLQLATGTFNSNAKNVTCGNFNANQQNTKTFTITNSTFTVASGTTTTGFIFQSTNTTFNVTGSNIVFTTSGDVAYYGGTATYPQVTMSGSGILNIGNGNTTSTITTLTNTVQPCTILVGTTTLLTVTNFNLNGTAGNLVTFNSSVTGIARTVTKASGTVNAYYLAIQDSNATGGAAWNAFNSVNNGNNTGWFFGTGFYADVAEDLFLQDVLAANANFLSNITEPLTLADTPDTIASFLSNITEPLTLADTPSVSAAFAGVITEDTTLADTQSITAAFASAITEAATLADSSIVLRTAFGDISEAITLDNNQTVIANFASVVFENFDAADSQSVVASFTAVIAENTNLADVESVLASFVSSLSEALTAEDSSIGIRIHNSDIIENTTLADIQDALRTHNALISENLVPADAITVIASFTSQITENLVLLDEPFPRGWFKIDDTQAENWVRVNNTDANTWTNINDGQLVVWTKVDNSFP